MMVLNSPETPFEPLQVLNGGIIYEKTKKYDRYANVQTGILAYLSFLDDC